MSKTNIKAKNSRPVVMICMGSDSDWPVMKEAALALDEFKVPYEAKILSAHRTPLEMIDFAKKADQEGFRVIIAGAGGAAHLPGMIASLSPLPVIGVPVPHGVLAGQDALMSIVQMPKGVPVATVAIGNAFNAGLLAVQILASGAGPDAGPDAVKLLSKMRSYKDKLRTKVLAKPKLKV